MEKNEILDILINKQQSEMERVHRKIEFNKIEPLGVCETERDREFCGRLYSTQLEGLDKIISEYEGYKILDLSIDIEEDCVRVYNYDILFSKRIEVDNDVLREITRTHKINDGNNSTQFRRL